MAHNTATAAITTIGPFGGNGGGVWDDYQLRTGITGVQGFTIGSGGYVDSFQAVYSTSQGVWLGPKHGGGGGGSSTITFGPGEVIVAAGIRSGGYVDALLFVTVDQNNVHRQYGPYGGTGGGYTGITGTILAFFGRSGSYVDAIGFYGYGLQKSSQTVTADGLVELARKHTAER